MLRSQLYSTEVIVSGFFVWPPPGFFRRFIANYGVPILVIVWSAVSYARVGSVPAGIPRRLTSPNPWKSPIATTHWDVVAVRTVWFWCIFDQFDSWFMNPCRVFYFSIAAVRAWTPLLLFLLCKFFMIFFFCKTCVLRYLHPTYNCMMRLLKRMVVCKLVAFQDMNDIPGVYIAAAIVPALMIVILYYFDHCVSAQLAQQPEFNLRKPFSYHYDLLLLGFTVKFSQGCREYLLFFTG